MLEEQGIEDAVDANLGGTVTYDWGWVKLVQAFHTSTVPGSDDKPYSPTPGTVIGAACGVVVNLGGKTVYHLGDTALFSDLKLIAERTPVDVAFIPIGGHYTMDRHDAVVAAEFVGAETVIPVHYDTFPPIETDAEAFKSDVESKTSSKVEVLGAGREPLGLSRPLVGRPAARGGTRRARSFQSWATIAPPASDPGEGAAARRAAC